MYEQIVQILKQNNITYDHFLWSDNRNTVTLDDGEFPIVEFMLGNDDAVHLTYAWLLVQNGVNKEERGYQILREIHLQDCSILILKESIDSSHLNEQETIEEKGE